MPRTRYQRARGTPKLPAKTLEILPIHLGLQEGKLEELAPYLMRIVIPWRYETPQQCSAYYPHLCYQGLYPDLVVGNWRYITKKHERVGHGFYLPRWQRYRVA